MGKLLSFLTIVLLCSAGVVFGEDQSPQVAHSALAASRIDSGDTAWILVSTALVMLMTPGLALFYGGMVRGKTCWVPSCKALLQSQ